MFRPNHLFQHPAFSDWISPFLKLEEDTPSLLLTHQCNYTQNRGKFFAKRLLKHLDEQNMDKCINILLSLYTSPNLIPTNNNELVTGLNQLATSGLIGVPYRAVIYLILLSIVPPAEAKVALLKERFILQLKCLDYTEAYCEPLMISLLAKFALITKDNALYERCHTQFLSLELPIEDFLHFEILALIIHPFELDYLQKTADYFAMGYLMDHINPAFAQISIAQSVKWLQILDILLLLLPNSLLRQYNASLFTPLLNMLPNLVIQIKTLGEFNIIRLLIYCWSNLQAEEKADDLFAMQPEEGIIDHILIMQDALMTKPNILRTTSMSEFPGHSSQEAQQTIETLQVMVNKASTLTLSSVKLSTPEITRLLTSINPNTMPADKYAKSMFINLFKQLDNKSFEKLFRDNLQRWISNYHFMKSLSIPLFHAISKVKSDKALPMALHLFEASGYESSLSKIHKIAACLEGLDDATLFIVVAGLYDFITNFENPLTKNRLKLDLAMIISKLHAPTIITTDFSAQKIVTRSTYQRIFLRNPQIFEMMREILCLEVPEYSIKHNCHDENFFNLLHAAICQLLACTNHQVQLEPLIYGLTDLLYYLKSNKITSFTNVVRLVGHILSFVKDDQQREAHYLAVMSRFKLPAIMSLLPLVIHINSKLTESELRRTITTMEALNDQENFFRINVNELQIALRQVNNPALNLQLLEVYRLQYLNSNKSENMTYFAKIIFTIVKNSNLENKKFFYQLVRKPLEKTDDHKKEYAQAVYNLDDPSIGLPHIMTATAEDIKNACFHLDRNNRSILKLQLLARTIRNKDHNQYRAFPMLVANLPAAIADQCVTQIPDNSDCYTLIALSVLSSYMTQPQLKTLNARLNESGIPFTLLNSLLTEPPRLTP